MRERVLGQKDITRTSPLSVYMEMFRQNEPILRSRDLLHRRAQPVPQHRIAGLTPHESPLHRRDATGDGGGSSTTPIVIGVVVPVVIIAIIMLVLWTRYKRVRRQEDANDKYKSLDFGVDPVTVTEKKGKARYTAQPEMSIAELKGQLRHDRGLSLDLSQQSPYILPPELHHSRESLRSLSRNGNHADDRYHATDFVPEDGSSHSRASIRNTRDDSSIFTNSTHRRIDADSRTNLVSRQDASESPAARKPAPVPEHSVAGLLPPSVNVNRDSSYSTASSNGGVAAIRKSNNYLGLYISGGQKKEEQPGLITVPPRSHSGTPANDRSRPQSQAPQELPSKRESVVEAPAPTHHAVIRTAELDAGPVPRSVGFPFPAVSAIPTPAEQPTQPPQQEKHEEGQNSSVQRRSQAAPEVYTGSAFNFNPRRSVDIPTVHVDQPREDDDAASDYYDEEVPSEYADYMAYSNRGSMIGMRPLPPDDLMENPEQRANRIRSFYKEYFDESKPNAGTNARVSYYDGSEDYVDDYYRSYHQHTYSGFSGVPSVYSDGRARAFSHNGHTGGSRAFSSMSAGRPPPNGARRPSPKKKMPPPKPLMVLPTPHKLKDDDFLPNAIDYAPPQAFQNQRSGTPDSGRGGVRPYSPTVRAFVPLQSSFDDLAVVPSP